MNADELSITIMNKNTRDLIQLTMNNVDNSILKNKIIFASSYHNEREIIVDNHKISQTDEKN